MKQRRFPSHDRKDCEEAAPDICYELLAMVQARDLNDYAKKNAGDPACADAVVIMQNCAIESFLLHYRSLREFFSDADKREADDIKAFDCLATWKSAATWVNDTTEVSRIHKRLAHVSTQRKTLDKNWDLAVMERNASQTFEDFISTLAPDQQVWFRGAAGILKQRIRPLVITLGDASQTSSSTASTVSFVFPEFATKHRP